MLVDEMMLQKLKEDALTGYNPTAKVMVEHKDAMDSALLAPSAGGVGPAVADDRRLALYAANQQRFQHLLRNATANATNRQPMASQMVQTDQAQTTSQAAQAEVETTTEATETEQQQQQGPVPLKPEANLARQFQIPQQYDRKFDAVLSTMASHPDIIGVTEDNELVVGNKVQKGTSFADLMRSLFVESGFPATGLSHLVGALHHIGVTEDMLSSKRAKEAMRSIATMADKVKREEASASSRLPTAAAATGTSKQAGQGKRRVTMATAELRQPPGKHMRVLRLYK